VLEVRDVTVRVGARKLLESVGFEAAPGEVVAIIGPNGAGKTTLLEATIGLRSSDSASVAVRNRPLVAFSDRARAFAYLPDAAELAPELDVRTLVNHALRHAPRPGEIVDAVRHALGLSTLLDRPCGVLSRGERQRVALFCVLAVERPVVVLDEPFNAFDPLQLRDVLAAVKRVAETGSAVVTTVHQLGDAQKVADRFLLLAGGRRVAWGDLAALRREASITDGSLEDVFVALLERGAHAP
jgi:ABC-type multidrug transport system ATPase subunit